MNEQQAVDLMREISLNWESFNQKRAIRRRGYTYMADYRRKKGMKSVANGKAK